MGPVRPYDVRLCSLAGARRQVGGAGCLRRAPPAHGRLLSLSFFSLSQTQYMFIALSPRVSRQILWRYTAPRCPNLSSKKNKLAQLPRAPAPVSWAALDCSKRLARARPGARPDTINGPCGPTYRCTSRGAAC